MKTNTVENKAASNNQQQFVDLRDFDDYEISTEYPHVIKRKSNNYVVHESDNGNGYIQIKLNGKKYYKHRIFALQFIENDSPDIKTDVDHRNHNRSDYHIQNLRWFTKPENLRNKKSYNGVECEYVDELSDDNIPI